MSENNQIPHLKELGNSKYEIVAGESDIRGWTVKNDFGRILGKVNDLILDTKAQKIKYFILDTDGNELYMVSRKILLPLEHAELDEVYKNVIYSGLMANELSSLPTYERSSLNNRTEEIIHGTFKNFGSVRNDQINKENVIRENHPAPSDSIPSSVAATSYNNKYETDEVRKQSVAGVFTTRKEAEAAENHLIENGFNRRDIDIAYRDEEDIAQGDIHKKEGISGFFSNLFSSEESDWLNSDDGRRYPVVIVNKLSIAEAERAAEILDRFGALNIDESLKTYRSKVASATNTTKRFRSRIIER